MKNLVIQWPFDVRLLVQKMLILYWFWILWLWLWMFSELNFNDWCNWLDRRVGNSNFSKQQGFCFGLVWGTGMGSKMEGTSAPAIRRDPYEVLSVSRDSSDQEIKTAYRKLALKYALLLTYCPFLCLVFCWIVWVCLCAWFYKFWKLFFFPYLKMCMTSWEHSFLAIRSITSLIRAQWVWI